jgi:hypothetical protein
MANVKTDRLPMTNAGMVVWPFALAAVAFGGSLAFACIFPFVAIAVVCAATMRAREAVATVAAVWIVNQVVGFTLMSYPHDASTYAWGIAIGVSSVASAIIAMTIVGAGRRLSVVRLIAAGVAAFATYEGLLFGFALYAGGLETFSGDIVGMIARNDALWLAGLMVLRLALTGIAPRWFGTVPALRLA